MSLSKRIRSGELKRIPERKVRIAVPIPEEEQKGAETSFTEAVSESVGEVLDSKLGDLSEAIGNIVAGLGDEADDIPDEEVEPPPKLRRELTQPYYVERKRALRPPEPQEAKEEQPRRYLFISDFKLTTSVLSHITSFERPVEYSPVFVNRTCKDLIDNGISNVWINIKVNKGRLWLENNLSESRGLFISVVVWASTKNSKYLADLESHVDVSSKLSSLKKLHSLSYKEMVEQLSNRVEIHEPPNCFAALLGCSNKVRKSKNV